MSRVSLLTIVLIAWPGAQVRAQIHRYEAENGQFSGTYVSNSVPGYSGSCYVTGVNNANDHFLLEVDVPQGLYEMWVGYRSPYGDKGYDYQVDGESGSGMFDQSSLFAEDRAGLFNLAAGTNMLSISKYWGYYDVDYLEFRPFAAPTLAPISPHLTDSQADHGTQVLMNYLTSQYGHKTLSGQQHQSSKNLSFPGQSYLDKSAGMVPAIRASDFIEYSPSRIQYGANPNNESEQSIAWAEQTGGIVTMSWHWNAPTDLINEVDHEWWRGFYTHATTFDLPAALANPGGEDYQLLLRDIDAIGIELQKFEDAGVPVIWRPLHEAQGGWFWWGAHGPDAFKELWNLTYDRLTNVNGLHNLIWEFTSSAATGDHLDWYPGDDVVDMIGLDIYTDTSANMSGQWYDILEQYNGRKLIALSETGTLPDPESMDQWGIDWSYFSAWSGEFVDAFTPAQLQATLGHEDVITLDQLPALPWNENGEFLSADFDFNGSVDGNDLATLLMAFSVTTAADTDGDSDTDGTDFLIWQRQVTIPSSVGIANGAIPEPSALALLVFALAAASKLRNYRPPAE
jgi:mannan endo-1,4-beta-mannosidase